MRQVGRGKRVEVEQLNNDCSSLFRTEYLCRYSGWCIAFSGTALFVPSPGALRPRSPSGPPRCSQSILRLGTVPGSGSTLATRFRERSRIALLNLSPFQRSSSPVPGYGRLGRGGRPHLSRNRWSDIGASAFFPATLRRHGIHPPREPTKLDNGRIPELQDDIVGVRSGRHHEWLTTKADRSKIRSYYE